MGQAKNQQIEQTCYCYFCQEEIRPDEPRAKLNLYTWVSGKKQELIYHPFHLDCIYEGDQRLGGE